MDGHMCSGMIERTLGNNKRSNCHELGRLPSTPTHSSLTCWTCSGLRTMEMVLTPRRAAYCTSMRPSTCAKFCKSHTLSGNFTYHSRRMPEHAACSTSIRPSTCTTRKKLAYHLRRESTFAVLKSDLAEHTAPACDQHLRKMLNIHPISQFTGKSITLRIRGYGCNSIAHGFRLGRSALGYCTGIKSKCVRCRRRIAAPAHPWARL